MTKKTKNTKAPAAVAPGLKAAASTLFDGLRENLTNYVTTSYKDEGQPRRDYTLPRKVLINTAKWAVAAARAKDYLRKPLGLDENFRAVIEAPATLAQARGYLPNNKIENLRKNFLNSVAAGEAVNSSNRSLSTKVAKVFEAFTKYYLHLETLMAENPAAELEVGLARILRYDLKTEVPPAQVFLNGNTTLKEVINPAGFIEVIDEIRAGLAKSDLVLSPKAETVIRLFANHTKPYTEKRLTPSHQESQYLQAFFRQICWYLSPEMVDGLDPGSNDVVAQADKKVFSTLIPRIIPELWAAANPEYPTLEVALDELPKNPNSVNFRLELNAAGVAGNDHYEFDSWCVDHFTFNYGFVLVTLGVQVGFAEVENVARAYLWLPNFLAEGDALGGAPRYALLRDAQTSQKHMDEEGIKVLSTMLSTHIANNLQIGNDWVGSSSESAGEAFRDSEVSLLRAVRHKKDAETKKVELDKWGKLPTGKPNCGLCSKSRVGFEEVINQRSFDQFRRLSDGRGVPLIACLCDGCLGSLGSATNLKAPFLKKFEMGSTINYNATCGLCHQVKPVAYTAGTLAVCSECSKDATSEEGCSHCETNFDGLAAVRTDADCPSCGKQYVAKKRQTPDDVLATA